MAEETQGITADQALVIIKYQEGHFGDVKSIDVKPNKMSQTISAFANTDSGELFVGIDEDEHKNRSWRGFVTIEDANAHLQILNELFPLGGSSSFEFLHSADYTGYVLHLNIAKTVRVVRATNSIPYIRKGAQNLPLTKPAELEQLARRKGITSFEDETVPVDTSVISESATLREFMARIIPSTEPVQWLQSQQLIVGDKPTVAGVVLFADEPQAIIAKHCGAKIYRYKSAELEGTRETLSGQPISVEGTAYDVIRETVAKTTEIIRSIPKLSYRSLEVISYPPETLHEIITNAILHRDYEIANDVHVRIYDDRVEVESPGLLPGHITEKNILREQFARNGRIVRLIGKFPDPPNKDVGEGLDTAFRAMITMRLKPPEIRQGENSVIVYIRHTPLDSPAVTVMNYLEEKEQITNRIGREITGLRSENSMKKVFVDLRDNGLIEVVPGTLGRGTAWRKVKPKDGTQLEFNFYIVSSG